MSSRAELWKRVLRCAAPKCNKKFRSRSALARFCSPACRNGVYAKNRYDTDEEYRQDRIKKARAWAIAHPEEVQERLRVWSEENPGRKAEIQRDYYHRDPGREIARVAKWKRENKDKDNG